MSRTASSQAQGHDRDRGDGPVSAAVLAPALLTIVFLMIQVGLWGTARVTASNAAQVGALSARGTQAQQSADTAARTYLGEIGGGGLNSVQVSATTGQQVTVTVQATAPSLLPLLTLPVTGTATAPLDRITQPATS